MLNGASNSLTSYSLSSSSGSKIGSSKLQTQTYDYLRSNLILSKNITLDNMSLGSNPYIGNAVGEDCVAMLNFAIRIKKADEALIKFSGDGYSTIRDFDPYRESSGHGVSAEY